MSVQGGGYGGGDNGYGSGQNGGGQGGYDPNQGGNGAGAQNPGSDGGAPHGQVADSSEAWRQDAAGTDGIPPKKKSPLPWILGGCGCLLVLALALAVALGLFGVLNHRPAPLSPEPMTTPATQPATVAVPEAPVEVAGYTTSDTTAGGMWMYRTPDGSDSVTVSFFEGSEPADLISTVEGPEVFGAWTCGEVAGSPSCFSGTSGGTVGIFGSQKSGADLAAWGDAFVAAWV